MTEKEYGLVAITNENDWLLKFVDYAGDHPTAMGGHQITIKFPNGYGVSVIRTPWSYGGSDGLYELAVLIHNPRTDDWPLHYTNPAAQGDVVGYLTGQETHELILKVFKFDEMAQRNPDDLRWSFQVGRFTVELYHRPWMWGYMDERRYKPSLIGFHLGDLTIQTELEGIEDIKKTDEHPLGLWEQAHGIPITIFDRTWHICPWDWRWFKSQYDY